MEFLENFTLNPKVKTLGIIFLISWLIFSVIIENRKTEVISEAQRSILELQDQINTLNTEVYILRSQINFLENENIIIRTSLPDCNLSYPTINKPN